MKAPLCGYHGLRERKGGIRVNVVDIAIVLILAIAVLGGYYRGFVDTALGLAATVLSYLLGMAGIPLVSGAIKGHETLYGMLQYYTEGAEYVAVTDVELTRTPIGQISREQLETIIQNADMPLPMGARVTRNIAAEAFSGQGVTTLGDYFNLTIISVVINIASLLIVFLIARIVFGIIIRGVEYGRGGYPVLARGDGLIGADVGLLQGVLILFAIFLLLPVALTVLPKLYAFIEESFFGEFFYRANFFISLIPGT